MLLVTAYDLDDDAFAVAERHWTLGTARLARFSTPLQSGVGAGKRATDLAVFLEIIRVEEGKLPEEERLNTKLMITKLRKLFYGSSGWDAHLIPGAADVQPLY